MSRPRLAVTGAGGFLGSAAVETLQSYDGDLRAQARPGDPWIPPCETTLFDLSDQRALNKFLDGVDVVVHLAGPPSVQASFRDPVAFAQAHVAGTAAVIEAMRKHSVRVIVYVSSAEVYGRPATAVVPEEHPLAPRSPYGAAKLGAEAFIRAAAFTGDITGYILRPFSIFGPRINASSLFGTIMLQLRAGDDVRIERVDIVRDFCHVSDVARAISLACRRPSAGMLTLNVGTGVATSAAELALTIGNALGRKVRLIEGAQAQRPARADIPRLVADASKISALLGWAPGGSMAERIRETVLPSPSAQCAAS